MTINLKDVRAKVAAGILTSMALGLMGTAWAIYNDVQAIKNKDIEQDKEIVRHDKSIQNIGSDVKDLHWYLIDSKRPSHLRKYQRPSP